MADAEVKKYAADVEHWFPASMPPAKGTLIVAFFERERTVWAGRYWGVKQSFSHGRPLQVPHREELDQNRERALRARDHD